MITPSMPLDPALTPCAIVLNAALDDTSRPQILHVYPSTIAHVKRARALGPLLIALWGVIRRVTGDAVCRHAHGCMQQPLLAHYDADGNVVLAALGALCYLSRSSSWLQGCVHRLSGQRMTFGCQYQHSKHHNAVF